VGNNLFFSGNDFVFGGEIIINIDSESLLRKILNMAERSLYVITGAKIFLDRLGLGGRLNDH